MANAGYHQAHQYDQAGLEVVHNYEGLQVAQTPDGLEVVPVYYEPKYMPGQEQAQYAEYYAKGYQDTTAAAPGVIDISSHPPQPPTTTRKKDRKTLIIVAVLGIIIIIVAVVVGVVVGTRKSSSSSSSSPSSSSTSISNTPSDPSKDDKDIEAEETVAVDPAAMTGSPTFVAPGLAPTAVSWGYPHLEIFALTKNTTYSVYRKYRNVNATSDDDFVPAGREMELVGGGVESGNTPAIAVNTRITEDSVTYRTEIHTNGKGVGYRKFHDDNQVWMDPSPDKWDWFPDFQVVGAPTEVKYNPTVPFMKLFYQARGQTGSLSNVYFTWTVRGGWSSATEVLGPPLQRMAPAVVAWNGNDTRLDLFAVSGDDSHLLHASWDTWSNVWTEYEDLGGFVTAPPVAVSRNPGVIDVFVRGGDGGLWHRAYDDNNKDDDAGGWSQWDRISGDTKIQGQPDAISIASGSLDVFAWGEDGSMLHKSFDTATNRWPSGDFDVLVKGTLSGPPKAVSDRPGSIHVLAYDDQAQLIWKTLKSGKSSDTVILADVPMMD